MQSESHTEPTWGETLFKSYGALHDETSVKDNYLSAS